MVSTDAASRFRRGLRYGVENLTKRVEGMLFKLRLSCTNSSQSRPLTADGFLNLFKTDHFKSGSKEQAEKLKEQEEKVRTGLYSCLVLYTSYSGYQ